MIQNFADAGTEDLYEGRDSRRARQRCPRNVWAVARRKLDQLDVAVVLEDLRVPPGNQLEALRGDRRGRHGIRINRQYRICFRWAASGPADVEVVDYHQRVTE